LEPQDQPHIDWGPRREHRSAAPRAARGNEILPERRYPADGHRVRRRLAGHPLQKSAFLREAIRQLALDRATVETSRYEELLAKPELHEAFDVVSVRAVRIEARVLTSLQAFVADTGVLLLFRGPDGPAAPTTIVPPLEWTGTYPLIDTLQSRLTVLTKRRIR
jgi:hypothetical protein